MKLPERHQGAAHVFTEWGDGCNPFEYGATIRLCPAMGYETGTVKMG